MSYFKLLVCLCLKMMEEDLFNDIRKHFCEHEAGVNEGKMMSSEAITFRGKVFAFFSRQKMMVFKLGKDFNPDNAGIEIRVFNPFTNRPPLNGWFEVPYTENKEWKPLAKRALNLLKSEL